MTIYRDSSLQMSILLYEYILDIVSHHHAPKAEAWNGKSNRLLEITHFSNQLCI